MDALHRSNLQVPFKGRMIFRTKPKKPLIPNGMRVYAIGDVHGRADLLDGLFSRIDEHHANNPVARSIEIFLGDYVDRGPSSRDVINRLLRRGSFRELIFLRGNHEVMFAEFLKDPSVLSRWQQVGGLETLMSYGLRGAISQPDIMAEALDIALPEAHRNFLAGLRPSFVCGDFFFVHAGVRPGIPLANQSEEDLFWIRDEFLEHTGDFEKVIVHGHTPVRIPDFRRNRINIDTGAYMTGRLTCVAFETDVVQTI